MTSLAIFLTILAVGAIVDFAAEGEPLSPVLNVIMITAAIAAWIAVAQRNKNTTD